MSTPSSAASALPAPEMRRVRPAFIALGALVGASLAIYLLVLLQAGLRHQDLDAYLGAGRDLLAGRPLYDAFLNHPFPDATLRPAYIYPPAFALLMAPLAMLPRGLAVAVWVILNQAALAGALVMVLRVARPGAWAAAALVAATATFYPLWIDVVQGQANLLVLLLLTAGLVGVLEGRQRWATALGVAAGLKLTPALLLIWLLVERRFRAAAWMLSGFAALTLAGALVRPQDTLVFFTRVAPALAHGTAVYANQSISGLVLRIGSVNPYTNPWGVLPWPTALTLVLAILLGACWWWQTRRDRAALRAAAFLPLLPLLSSVTWPHHLVLLLPLIWLAFAALGRSGWPAARTATLVGLLLLFSVAFRLPVGPAFGKPGFRLAQTTDPLVFLVANTLLLGTLILFMVGPWLLRDR